MTLRPSRRATGCATDREVGVVAAVLVSGPEKAAAHRLGLSHSTVKHHLANARFKVGVTTTAQLVWILAPRLPEPDGSAPGDEKVGSSHASRAASGPGGDCGSPAEVSFCSSRRARMRSVFARIAVTFV